MSPPRIRPGKDSDGPAIIELIWSCWSRYPGIRMDVDREMPELRAPAGYYADHGGALWVADEGARLTGMTATRPIDSEVWEICRVYVDPTNHGGGLGHGLLDIAEQHAIASGAENLTLWSDTRFDRAHRFYEKRSYVRNGPIRVLQDISNSLEYGYAKPVNGVAVLDIAAATSAAKPLAEILVGCAQAGDPVGFLAPLSAERAGTFFRRAASDVGAGTCVMVAAWRDGTIVGGGLLDLDMPETQTHCAVVRSVLVSPPARRMGLGRMIMEALEQQARALTRTLLTVETRAGWAGEALCRSLGWQQVGRIPGHTRDSAGAAYDSVLLWKPVS